MLEMLENIGEMSPIYFVIITSYFLYKSKRPYYLGGYFAFLVLNELLNYVLKGIIREKRPHYDKNYKYEESPLIGNMIPITPNIYGMPSNHMQNLFFSCVFLYCVIQNNYILMFELLFISIVIYYRYTSKIHSMEQLVVGSLVGSLVGYLSFLGIKHYVYHKSIFVEKIFSL